MKVTPLAVHSPRAVIETLERHGWEPGKAALAAAACDPVVLHLEGLDGVGVEALLHQATRLGIDLVSGDDWVIMAGMRSRFSAFGRPWQLPPELAEPAFAIGAALPEEPPLVWRHARGVLDLSGPRIAGIINVTPDSFSDGGQHKTVDQALSHAGRLIEDGADLLDVGGESTRPGATPVDVEEEVRRVVPVVKAIAARFPHTPIAVDTVKAGVASRALDAGAAIVNDVSGLRLDGEMVTVVAEGNAGLILMHSRGGVAEMARLDDTGYGSDTISGILEECRAMVDRAEREGIKPEHTVLDPGFGFSKDSVQSLLLLDQLAAFQVLGLPLYVGVSRKRFLGEAIRKSVKDRDAATATGCVMALERGARIFRVHEVAPVREALDLATCVRTASRAGAPNG